MKELRSNNKNYPGISKLVDSIYTEELDDFIIKNVCDDVDKRTVLMFTAMIFIVLLQLNKSDTIENKKEMIKQIVSSYIANPQKRSEVIQFFSPFLSTVQNQTFKSLEY